MWPWEALWQWIWWSTPGHSVRSQHAWPCSLPLSVLVTGSGWWLFPPTKFQCEKMWDRGHPPPPTPTRQDYPGGSVVENSPVNAGNTGGSGLIPGWGRCLGEGNGNPLQYSCFGNPKDKGALWATVHRVTESWTRLNWLSTHAGMLTRDLGVQLARGKPSCLGGLGYLAYLNHTLIESWTIWDFSSGAILKAPDS